MQFTMALASSALLLSDSSTEFAPSAQLAPLSRTIVVSAIETCVWLTANARLVLQSPDSTELSASATMDSS